MTSFAASGSRKYEAEKPAIEGWLKMKRETPHPGARLRSTDDSDRRAMPARTPTLTQLGRIPGLERLVPGTHDPRRPVRSRFGTFKLPVRFHGRDVALIADGALLGP